MKLLDDYDYMPGNGSETFYSYFFNKVGIGANPDAPVTKFLELIIDCFYNNSDDLTNLLYDGVLSQSTARNLDDVLRSNWLNKLGVNYNLPNKKGLIPQYKEKEFLSNDEYNHYLYLRNCNLRTLKDWKTHFNKCFLTEKNSDITDRISYDNNKLVLNYSIHDTVLERWFMSLIMKYLCDYNLIDSSIDDEYYNIVRDDLNTAPVIKGIGRTKYINYKWVAEGFSSSYYRPNGGVAFVRNSDSPGVLRSINDTVEWVEYDTTYSGDFVVSFKFRLLIPGDDKEVDVIKFGLVDNNNQWVTYKNNIELGVWDQEFHNINIIRDNNEIFYYIDDVLISEVSINDYNKLKLNIVTESDLNIHLIMKEFRGYNIPKPEV